MDDLETAREILRRERISLVIVKSSRILFKTSEYGVIGLIRAIENHGENLVEAAVADRVVGKAAAMLCRYAKVAGVYADVISMQGARVLMESGIRFEYGEMVPEILNKERNDICPFEKLVAGCSDEKECYRKILSFLEEEKF